MSPEVHLSSNEVHALAAHLKQFASVDELEQAALDTNSGRSPLQVLMPRVREATLDLWGQHDHVVIRGVPHRPDGASLVAVAWLFFEQLKTYRGTKVVKRFRMSPWTNDLSHTLADGHFHTDINTAPVPPRVTLMQCLVPDPCAPDFGQLRVVQLPALLAAARQLGNERIWRFLAEEEVTMVNDRESKAWRGNISRDGEIRFHPQTLKDAANRYGDPRPDMEECLYQVHSLCLSLSTPIDLQPGDMLIVSNRRALHQRGSCTVKFNTYPRDFDTREVAVAHAMDEPA